MKMLKRLWIRYQHRKSRRVVMKDLRPLPTTLEAAELQGWKDYAAGRPLSQKIWQQGSKAIWLAYRRGYDWRPN